ncbi:GntR family transcriptional regulator [Mycoplana rhizolycopersici]|jgi:GntR family carbon starvation induced transcriptional regulator|uniref:GntR family transcriptional regulator n=1 Tax=Mycoplana rhizolycopersici TaxID=2746702 RepID=A0ABX2QIA5_9HYPH|nr:GntR family transcriptional regulator [Rhizobium rhizolycopersici]NVP56938.1 GntR family transcriptional regulator [Rhizobium rhizolycopersici]
MTTRTIAPRRATPRRVEKETAATTVYHALKRDIVHGVLEPGHKLLIDQIAERYSAGTNPVREALNRLSSERLVDREDLRGFFVPPISLDDFRDIVRTRCWVEGKALEESIRNRTEAWEDAIILANHRLQNTPIHYYEHTEPGMPPPDNSPWEERHRTFHRALIANCGSRHLLRFADELMLLGERYRFISMANSYPRRRSVDEHQAIVDAALAGDTKRAVEALQGQYQLTLKIYEETMSGE